jgi:hypothetical protein
LRLKQADSDIVVRQHARRDEDRLALFECHVGRATTAIRLDDLPLSRGPWRATRFDERSSPPAPSVDVAEVGRTTRTYGEFGKDAGRNIDLPPNCKSGSSAVIEPDAALTA